jgi:PleD family two-component response regulator
VRHAVAAVPRIVNGAAVRVTVSAGVTGGDADATVALMLEAADRALYRAKRGGRNRVERASDVPLVPSGNVVRIA